MPDEDARPYPMDAYATPQNGALLSSATETLLYAGAVLANIHDFRFNEFTTSTSAAGTIPLMQFAIYQAPNGAMPTSFSQLTLIDYWDHAVTPAGLHQTSLGKTVTVGGGFFVQVHGRSPNDPTGTLYRLDSWAVNDLGLITNDATAHPVLTPSHFKTDITVTDPPPATLAGTISGEGAAFDVANPICRYRII